MAGVLGDLAYTDMIKYTIPVNFIATYWITVDANNEYEARDLAETEASELFQEDLDNGLLGTSDFACESQESV